MSKQKTPFRQPGGHAERRPPGTEALVFACRERGGKRPVYIDLMEAGDD